MKLVTYISYFSRLRAIVGLGAVSTFALTYLVNKIAPPRNGVLAHVSVGPYIFYFPSIAFFEALFIEIFCKETYYLASTEQPIRMIDCGANIGVSLLYFKIRAPHARIQCFEPNPDARAVLEKNIAANDWEKDVQVFPYALGKRKGTVDFFVDDTEATSSSGSLGSHQKNKSRGLNSYTVTVDTLSSYIDGNIELLKIDIEGSELDVLEEMVAHRKLRFVAHIQLEYHYIPEIFTRPLSDILTLLESEGFHTFVESNTLPHRVIGRNTWHTCMVFAWH